jgi:glyoxylase-like metal-dependent hydrolase (beta-lactamase superfamily II)
MAVDRDATRPLRWSDGVMVRTTRIFAAGLGVVGLVACNADPSGGGTSFTSAGEDSSTTSGSTDDGPPPPSDSSSSGAVDGSTSTTSGGSESSGGDTTTGGEPNMVDCAGVFPAAWQNGTDCMTEFPFQVHQYGYGTVILRESLCVHSGAPFQYMLFGDEQALLLDTGTGDVSIAAPVLDVVDQWLTVTGRASIELLVVNTHDDGDHAGGNYQFDSTPFATIVGSTQAETEAYFGIDQWPDQIVTHDLGGRQIDIIPIPGHLGGHIAVYDHQTGMLLTGDTLQAGRLYITDFDAYVASIQRLVAHTEIRDVCQVLGSHIEMTNDAGVPFPFGAQVHLDEHELELSRDHLLELRDSVEAMAALGSQSTEVHDDFIVFPL